MTVSSENRESFISSFSIYVPFISFVIVLAVVSCVKLGDLDVKDITLVPDLSREALSLLSSSKMLCTGILNQVQEVLFNP